MSAVTSPALPLYGRKFKLQVLTPVSDSGNSRDVITIADSSLQDESLHIKFDVYTQAFQSFWYAEIIIYNLDLLTTETLLQVNATSQSQIQQGMQVILQAGLGEKNYDTIFEGPVFQAMWERENQTDFKLTLHCIIGLLNISYNSVNDVYGVPLNQNDILKRIVEQSFSRIPVDTLSSQISTKQLPRGKVMFGSPAKYFDQIANDNQLQWWLSRKGLVIGSALTLSSDPAIVYTPETGIIGTPQQTQDGVSFRILLDPRIQIKQPAMTVKIDNSSIRLLKKQIGDFPAILDQDGIYAVAGVRYLGDTRGDDWYCDITGYTAIGRLAVVGAVQ